MLKAIHGETACVSSTFVKNKHDIFEVCTVCEPALELLQPGRRCEIIRTHRRANVARHSFQLQTVHDVKPALIMVKLITGEMKFCSKEGEN